MITWHNGDDITVSYQVRKISRRYHHGSVQTDGSFLSMCGFHVPGVGDLKQGDMINLDDRCLKNGCRTEWL